MTKQEFDAIFESCKQKFLPNDQAQLQEKLRKFADESGKVSPQALAMFTYVETIQYTNDMLYAVLSQALDIKE